MNKSALIAAACLSGLAASAGAQVLPDYGFEFVTVGATGNAAYVGDLFDDDHLRGRGAVDYEYRISTTEIRTSDWLEFVNAARSFPLPLDTAYGARFWGAAVGRDPKTGKEMYFQFTKESGDWPVAGISWWAAATYANWLHNDKALTKEAFLSGAYDLSTFGFDPDTGTYSDGPTHSPGARFWIPTTDEWMKAAHYDPDKDGPGEGGWWKYPNGSDTKPVTGIPGVGETNADLFDIIGHDAWDTPVGSYPETQTPWGLLDVSGGASEWTEDWRNPDDPYDRITDGSSINTGFPADLDPDLIGMGNTASRPDGSINTFGLRLASSVPAPSGGVLIAAAYMFTFARRKRSF